METGEEKRFDLTQCRSYQNLKLAGRRATSGNYKSKKTGERGAKDKIIVVTLG